MIKVFIVDDQMVVRSILSQALSEYPDIEVVGTASNALIAKKMIPQVAPDIVTLDVEMPGMNGIELLDWLNSNYSVSVIMLSTLTSSGTQATLEALEKGAMDFVRKADGSEKDFLRMLEELSSKIQKLGKQKKVIIPKKIDNKIFKQNVIYTEPKEKKIHLIAIGASTGGTQALAEIFKAIPKNLPPIVVVQHMPEHFTKLFANRLSIITGIPTLEVEQGMHLEKGKIYIAPGNFHIRFKKAPTYMFLELDESEKVSGHRPSVDVLFGSIAKSGMSPLTLAILLTGMGRDGASGLLELKNGGAYTIAQDEESSAVYGMPREAVLLGAVAKQLSLSEIPEEIVSRCS